MRAFTRNATLLFVLFPFVIGLKPLAHAADNRYCGSGDIPKFGASKDGPAALPTACVHTAITGTPSPGRMLQVPAGGDLQAALNNARCGDTIQLQAGATFTGLFTLPAKSCDAQHWITIRTSAPNSSLPPEGKRISPCYAGVSSLLSRPDLNCSSTKNVLAKILYPLAGGTSGPVGLAPGASHYRLLGLEITRLAGTGRVSTLLWVRYRGKANHIVLDRVWMHGNTHDDTGRAVHLNGMTFAAIIDSFLSDFHCTSVVGCGEAQAIVGGSGDHPGGPYKIVNNFLEASTENIMMGGGSSSTTPTDIEIRRNHFFKPMIWKMGSYGYVGGISGNPFSVKNHLEFKNARRVLFEGNVLENNWGGFSQSGFSILLSAKNQTVGTVNVCPICQVTDITIRYSKISHVGAGFQLVTVRSDGGGVALAGARYSIHDITIDDVDSHDYQGTGTLFLLANTWKANVLHSIVINHITGFPDSDKHLLTLLNDLSNPDMTDLSFTNNLVLAARYPVWSAGGGSTNCAYYNIPNKSIPRCFQTYSLTRNGLIAVNPAFPPSMWPTGNYFPVDVGAVEFANFALGDYRLLNGSRYKNAGTDGKDLGADINALNSATLGVR